MLHSKDLEGKLILKMFVRFGGFQCHSSQYRHPAQEQFVQKSVLIVGGGLSGIDIAVDIASTARTVMISAERGLVPVRKSLGDNVIKESFKKKDPCWH